jgi:asparagine synthase (glutamine-hydrolysing)
MGHHRLSIIGLGDAGRQPYALDGQECQLVYNGEIYNYAELADELAITAESDTQVLFEILRRRDYSRLRRMRGMYAFAFCDPASGLVITGRDPFGIKPLYMGRHQNGDISFASVPAALAQLPEFGTGNPDGFMAFLIAGFVPSGLSAFSGVSKVPPGRITEWRRQDSSWQATNITIAPPQPRFESVAEALRDSVEAHLVADVPVGVLMSGGVDSTLIAALAAKLVPNINTYTISNPDHPEIDEAKYANWNAKLLGSRHVVVPVRPRDMVGQLDLLVRSSGEPFGDAAFLPLSVLCARVSEDLKVVLAGEGADEIFGGYRRYEVERWLYAGKVPAAVLGRVGALARGRDRLLDTGPSRVHRTMSAWQTGPGLQSHLDFMFGDRATIEVCLPELVTSGMAALEEAWGSQANDQWSFGLEANRAFDFRQWLPNVLLEKSDRASMQNGVEVRVPFLDLEVAAVGVNPGVISSKKAVLRRALSHELPGVRLPKRKMGLSVASDELMLQQDMVEAVDRQLESSDSLLRAMGLVRSELLRERCRSNPTLAFRLAAVDAWQRAWT